MLIWQQERVLKRLVLSPPERQRLRERVRSPRRRAEEVQRAKNILLIASGKSQWAASRQLGCSINTVRFWLNRFVVVEERLAGLFSRHRGKVADQQSVKLEARILAAAHVDPGRWSKPKHRSDLVPLLPFGAFSGHDATC